MRVKNGLMALMLVLALAACGQDNSNPPASKTTAEQTGPDFVLTGIDGRPYRLSDYRGKWVVVNYWATWCPPCLEEIPELVDFHERHKESDAVVLGVNYEDKGARELSDFAEEYLISYPVLLGEVGSGKNVGPIPGLPTTYVISPEGEMVARQVGPLNAKMLDDFIAEQGKQSGK